MLFTKKANFEGETVIKNRHKPEAFRLVPDGNEKLCLFISYPLYEISE